MSPPRRNTCLRAGNSSDWIHRTMPPWECERNEWIGCCRELVNDLDKFGYFNLAIEVLLFIYLFFLFPLFKRCRSGVSCHLQSFVYYAQIAFFFSFFPFYIDNSVRHNDTWEPTQFVFLKKCVKTYIESGKIM